jgi:hypothetical protein
MSVTTGVYFVAMRVEAGNQSGSAYVSVKKMMLLR